MKVKENSIEEDILNIEKYIELVTKKNYCECNELNEICSGGQGYGSRNVAYSMKRILSDYKRVLRENEELKVLEDDIQDKRIAYIDEPEFEENVIPVQKVKDIIDRIDYDIKRTKEIISNNRRNDYQIVRLKAMNTKSLDIKKRLQKLLESEE